MLSAESFLQAILDQPEDDEPRLHFANWLDERCDPLGEFIRVQCRLARMEDDAPHLGELETRERELLAEFEMTWVADLASWVDWWAFRRGFIEEIGLTAHNFLIHGSLLFQKAPILTVHIRDAGPKLEALARSSALGRPQFLDFSSNQIKDEGVEALGGAPALARLEGLNLSSTGLSDLGMRALAHSPYLSKLRELYLDDNKIHDQAALEMAASPLANRLETLHLKFNPISNQASKVLHKKLGAKVHL